MKARILFVPAKSDMIFPPELSERAAARYRAQGGVAEVVVIDGDGGHLDGVFAVAQAGRGDPRVPREVATSRQMPLGDFSRTTPG